MIALPLTKERFLHLSSFYEQLQLEEKGGYDTGIWFSFRSIHPSNTISQKSFMLYGRKVSPHGFCSPTIRITKKEIKHPNGVETFLKCAKKARLRYARWLEESQSDKNAKNLENSFS